MEKQLQELSNQVTVLKRPIVKLTVDVENILTLLKTQVRTSAKTSSEDEEDDENPIQLPCDSMEQFEQFNENLKSNKKYKKKIIYLIKRSIDERRALVRNMGSIIRQYMCQNVAQNYTTVKQMAGKKVFKGTEFYKCLEVAASTRFKKEENPLTEKQFKEAIQAVLNNVKDWNGKRMERRERAQNTEAENSE